MITPASVPPRAAAAARQLRASVRGSVLEPADASYDGARQLWNGAIDRRPAVIVRCVDDNDVAVAVRTAREHGLPVSVLGGGHDWAGRALRENGLLIDLSAMRRVTVDAASSTATIDGGTRTGDLVRSAGEYGLAPVTGTVNAVGLTGLTLAGGYGLLAGQHGLALDNLLGARIVLADGSQVIADATQNPDLYWAIRGGGGNFGVATTLRYRVHPISTVLSGLLLFPLSDATSVLRGYGDVLAEAPDELTVMSGFFCGPDGQPLLFLLPTWSGDLGRGEYLVSRFAKLGTPVAGQLAPMRYPDVLSQFDDVVVNGRHNDMHTRWLPELTEASISAIVAAAGRMTSPYSSMFLHHFHGAATRVHRGDTAFALRRDHLLVEIVASWVPSDGANDGVHRRWTRMLSDELAPHALPGGYANLLGADEHDRALLGFGENARKLLAVKHRYDPDNVFSAVGDINR